MPKQSHQFILLLLVLGLGCAKGPKITIKEPSVPVLTETHGSIHFGGVASLHIQYKDINLLIDPLFLDANSVLPAASESLKGMESKGEIKRSLEPKFKRKDIPAPDYLLLTDTNAHHFGPLAKESFRKNLKVITTAQGEKDLRRIGFSNVKALGTGQKLMLKKKKGFLFVHAVQAKNSVSGHMVNGYFLEFDNGRNIFVSGEIVDLDSIRNLVYTLRDDAKEVHLAFIYSGGIKDQEDNLQSADEALAAEIVSLLQPQVAYLIQTQSLNVTTVDKARLDQALQGQILMGKVHIAKPGEKFTF